MHINELFENEEWEPPINPNLWQRLVQKLQTILDASGFDPKKSFNFGAGFDPVPLDETKLREFFDSLPNTDQVKNILEEAVAKWNQLPLYGVNKVIRNLMIYKLQSIYKLQNKDNTLSESKKKALKDKEPTARNSDTHSVIDGLNRAQGAIDSGEKFIYAKEIDRRKLKPLNPQEIKRFDQIASKAKKRGDYYTGSTFGNGKHFYSVEAAVELALNAKPIKLSLKPGSFVYDQVSTWWQGDKQRARKAIESSGPNAEKHPILIAKNKS